MPQANGELTARYKGPINLFMQVSITNSLEHLARNRSVRQILFTRVWTWHCNDFRSLPPRDH